MSLGSERSRAAARWAGPHPPRTARSSRSLTRPTPRTAARADHQEELQRRPLLAGHGGRRLSGEGDLPGRPEPATTEISVAQLAEVDRITTEDAYAEDAYAEALAAGAALGAGAGRDAHRGHRRRPGARPRVDKPRPRRRVGPGVSVMRPADIMEGTDQVLEDLGHTPTRYEDEITWRMPTAEEATKLHLAPGVPVGRLLRTTFDHRDRPVEVYVVVLPGDRHVLLYEVSAE